MDGDLINTEDEKYHWSNCDFVRLIIEDNTFIEFSKLIYFKQLVEVILLTIAERCLRYGGIIILYIVLKTRAVSDWTLGKLISYFLWGFSPFSFAG